MDIEKLREKNIPYDNRWLFPVRMENSREIRWVANIVEAFGKFNAPITQSQWTTCLRRKSISAATDEENILLRQWWTKGWQEMDRLPLEKDKGTPVLQLATEVLGDTLEVIYPTLAIMGKCLKQNRRQTYETIMGTISDGIHWYKPLRQIHYTSLEERDQNKWTVFTPNNLIAGRFRTKLEIADFLGCTRKQVDVTIATPQHQFFGGYWLWKDDWGFNPITPQGIELPPSWQIDCAQKQE